MTLKFDGWPRKSIVHLFHITISLVHHFKTLGEFKLELLTENAQFGSKSVIFLSPVTFKIWWMTLKNNRAPLPCYIKLCASLQSHLWIQTGVTVRKRSIRVKIGNCLSCVTLKFDWWLWKTIGHLFYAASSFVHHFIAIGEFTLKLVSGNAQFGSKSAIICPVWPWNLTDDLGNNKAPFLCHFKLCASFCSHCRIKTGVTVWKRPIWVKIDDFFSRVTLEFDGWPWKIIGHLS